MFCNNLDDYFINYDTLLYVLHTKNPAFYEFGTRMRREPVMNILFFSFHYGLCSAPAIFWPVNTSSVQ
jgi:hypothetical protein